MTKFESLARNFFIEAEREAENCLPFFLATLRPLDGKFFETLEASTLAREKLRYGCSYWNVRDMLLCGVRTGALEFFDGHFKIKKFSQQPSVNVKAWRKSIVKILRLKKMIRNLELFMAGRPPEFIFQKMTQAAEKLAENFCPLPNKSSVLLVNRAHPLPKDYVAENLIELAKVPRHFLLKAVEMRLAEAAYFAAEEMFAAAAAKEGFNGFLILSGYRDKTRQAYNFSHGKPPGYVATPGTSEHETGLAMDISAETGDDTRFEHTPHFSWLENHAHEYGFILRYPKFKEKFTGVFYEPHHYRYVGKEAARAIHDKKISLEEYCAGEIEQPARQSAANNPVYDPREIYRSIFGEKMRGHGQRWSNIDLPLLKSINPDTVGWIFLAKSPINYPVVRAREDDYYLRHNFSGEESIHGAITMNGDKLNRYNTIFSGHNMKDWSMFCAVVELDEQNYLETHSKFGLLIEGRRFDVEIFACVGYWAGDMREERTDFEDDEDFAWWLKNIRARSRVKTNVEVTAKDTVVTFSTCAYPIEGDFDQYAAYGVLRELKNETPGI